MIKNKEKKFAKRLISLLNKRGFIVKAHKSKTSKSIYLKIDNGLISNVRISDHKRYNDDNCKYNVIRKYDGPRLEIVKGKLKKYYQYASIGRLVTDIILRIGYQRYKDKLTKKNNSKKENIYQKKVA